MTLGVTCRVTFILASLILLFIPPPAEPSDKVPVWIDTDPACGRSDTDDVDDCWALLMALRSPELSIRGISTVYGNVDGGTAFATATSVVKRFSDNRKAASNQPHVYRGSNEKGQTSATDATVALAKALLKEQFTIIAIGPLTNIATLIKKYPDLVPNIKGIVAIAGNRPGQRRFFLGNNRLIHFHDLNFRKDADAYDIVLTSGVPLVLIPFEVANKVTINQEDLTRLTSAGGAAQWLAETSDGWMRFWEDTLGMDGFHPFDSLAVGYVTTPSHFTCEVIPARIKRRRSRFVIRHELEVSHNFRNASTVTYCFDINSQFKIRMIDQLTGNP
jgi:purine nucleosidase